MRPALPGLSYHFGIKWQDIVEMPPGELDAYLDQLHDINKAAQKAARGR